ncbi:NYN domain-containing protein [uncultured Litoreibacter sp.]|uniref:NYN domain-containing protein n=1 Tax=uncultured Litoreibacter sp. TaxID=1392394 RepID=UPI00261A7AF9|nr:NYN domain-containing protein [uncultured Litoreibacter sp.]
MRSVIVYVDGFNLYHALDDLGDDSLKWLCLRRLAESIIGPNERLKRVKYFSAYATWMPEAYGRHRAYVAALKAEGVQFIPGKFKKKFLKCKKCRAQYQTHEEKETDVNIGIHLVRDTFENSFDRAIVISADTDMRTAIEMARNINGTKSIDVVAPPNRFGRARSLKPLFGLSVGKIRAARLNDHYDLGGGKSSDIPENYKPIT